MLILWDYFKVTSNTNPNTYLSSFKTVHNINELQTYVLQEIWKRYLLLKNIFHRPYVYPVNSFSSIIFHTNLLFVF